MSGGTAPPLPLWRCRRADFFPHGGMFEVQPDAPVEDWVKVRSDLEALGYAVEEFDASQRTPIMGKIFEATDYSGEMGPVFYYAWEEVK